MELIIITLIFSLLLYFPSEGNADSFSLCREIVLKFLGLCSDLIILGPRFMLTIYFYSPVYLFYY